MKDYTVRREPITSPAKLDAKIHLKTPMLLRCNFPQSTTPQVISGLASSEAVNVETRENRLYFKLQLPDSFVICDIRLIYLYSSFHRSPNIARAIILVCT